MGDEATATLDRSQQRLRTGHVDLWPLHPVSRAEDPDGIFAPDGAMRALDTRAQVLHR